LAAQVPTHSSLLGTGHAFTQAMIAWQFESHRFSTSQQLLSSQL
jgi:hypothetical protein